MLVATRSDAIALARVTRMVLRVASQYGHVHARSKQPNASSEVECGSNARIGKTVSNPQAWRGQLQSHHKCVSFLNLPALAFEGRHRAPPP